MMNEPILQSRLHGEKRVAVGRVAAKIGTRAIRSFDTTTLTHLGSNKYRTLASHLNNAWQQTIQSTELNEMYPRSHNALKDDALEHLAFQRSGVYTGFRVTGAVLAMTVAAYNRWAPVERRSLEELVTIQKNPITIDKSLLMLARKSNDVNRSIEEALCLNEGATEYALAHGDIPFKVVQRDGDPTYIAPDAIRIIQQCGVESIAAPANDNAQCPAQRFLPILWNVMVDSCARDERFFAADLGLVEAA